MKIECIRTYHLRRYSMRMDCYRLSGSLDHQVDPQATKNIAGDYPELVKQLMSQLDAGWNAAV